MVEREVKKAKKKVTDLNVNFVSFLLLGETIDNTETTK